MFGSCLSVHRFCTYCRGQSELLFYSLLPSETRHRLTAIAVVTSLCPAFLAATIKPVIAKANTHKD